MGLFDKLKRGKSNLTMDAIICEEYEQQYFDECKYIWKNYVPQSSWIWRRCSWLFSKR